ncbi:uncharacterized protein LOC133198241 [Saccostrea echinata]|uniref:uncharacterized protein LOC133198241 n=1 Tax=Saccostrea echinata TaxID=191078 RepID=UPI002A82F7E4|nr:uncharacterized protein LOC133198241 [Saccostrea echinata]
MREFGKYFRCTEHNKAISLFCNDHEQPCCFICTGTCGAKHRECKSIDSIQKAASTVKDSGKLDSLLNEVRIIEKKLKDAKREQEKNISELEDSVDKMTKESEKEFKELVDHIENLKNKHVDELAVAQKRGRQEMDQCTRTLNDGMNCVNYCYQNVGKARETENENEILMNYYTAKETASQLNQFSFTKKHIKISLKKASILKNLKVAKSILDIQCSESKHQVLLSVSALALPRAPAFSIKEKDANIFTASFLANDTFAIIDHRVDVTAITEQGDIAWKYEHLSMKQPCELDKDSVGNVFVAAKERMRMVQSHTLFYYNPNLEFTYGLNKGISDNIIL